jgi:hypothetical protein
MKYIFVKKAHVFDSLDVPKPPPSYDQVCITLILLISKPVILAVKPVASPMVPSTQTIPSMSDARDCLTFRYLARRRNTNSARGLVENAIIACLTVTFR